MTNRKTILQQSALALAGSCLPFSKLLAREFAKEKIPLTLDNYHPIKCSIDLATAYQYMYKEKTDGSGDVDPTSDIMVSPVGYYSEGGTATNPYCNDVVYDAEGAGPDTSCEVAAPDGCHNYDYNKSNPLTYEGQNPFRYKVYYPKETIHNYTTTPLPAYIFFHAGGFQECTSFEGGQIKQLCIQLSQKGFICFTVEYRRGRIFDSNDPTKFSVQRQFASYRTIQDGCGAIRSFMKKTEAEIHSVSPLLLTRARFLLVGKVRVPLLHWVVPIIKLHPLYQIKPWLTWLFLRRLPVFL